MHNEIITIGSITIYGYGLMIGIGFIVALLLASYCAKKRGLDTNHVSNIAIIALVSGWIGGKFFFVLTNWSRFLESPRSVLGPDGFVVYGGIIIGAISAYIYCRIKKLNFAQYFDLLMPAVAVNQGFGRIGCFLAGCCYGRETHSFLGVVFPEGSFAPAGIPLYPTQIFSSIGDFIIAGILLWYTPRQKHDGNTGALYCVLYGVGRFLIEMLRNDERGTIFFFSTSQFISIFIVLLGVGLFIKNKYFANKRKSEIE